MANRANDVRPFYSVDDVTHGVTSSDGAGSLGGVRASNNIYFPFVTDSAGTRRSYLDSTPSTAITDSNPGDVMVINQDANAGQIVEFVSVDDSTGEVTFDDLLGTASISGDTGFIYRNGELFNDVTADEARTGIVDFRCVYIANVSGVQYDEINVRSVLVKGLSSDVEFGMATVNSTVNDLDTTVLTDRFDTPTYSELNAVTFPTIDAIPAPVGTLIQIPATAAPDFGVSSRFPVWIKRTISPGARPQKVTCMFEFQSVTTGGNPSPMIGRWATTFNIAANAPDVAVNLDRQINQAGGARVVATVTDPVTGDPLVGRSVSFSQTVGPGTLTQGAVGSTNRITNELGQAFATYQAPDGSIGATVTFEAEVKI